MFEAFTLIQTFYFVIDYWSTGVGLNEEKNLESFIYHGTSIRIVNLLGQFDYSVACCEQYIDAMKDNNDCNEKLAIKFPIDFPSKIEIEMLFHAEKILKWWAFVMNRPENRAWINYVLRINNGMCRYGTPKFVSIASVYNTCNYPNRHLTPNISPHIHQRTHVKLTVAVNCNVWK